MHTPCSHTNQHTTDHINNTYSPTHTNHIYHNTPTVHTQFMSSHTYTTHAPILTHQHYIHTVHMLHTSNHHTNSLTNTVCHTTTLNMNLIYTHTHLLSHISTLHIKCIPPCVYTLTIQPHHHTHTLYNHTVLNNAMTICTHLYITTLIHHPHHNNQSNTLDTHTFSLHQHIIWRLLINTII